ncbi:MAG: efflux RND transporter periplasmic adaptor subunit [Calditrichaeota bacterium]|nr:efflux RND transporter periplasmic adaptor subunit [Calditrichota bacterium]
MKRFAVISLGLLLWLVGCKSNTEKNPEKIVPVTVLKVKPDSIATFTEITGNLKAERDALVISQTSERLLEILKPVGSRVKINEVIARLDNRLLQQGKNQAEAALKSARARYESVKQDYQRYQRLFKEKAISDQQWEQVKTGMREAEAAVEQMEAAYAQARERYENSFIKAPFSGIVGSIYFDVGQMIPAGQPVAKIINPEFMKARLYVPDVYYNQLKINQDVIGVFPVLPEKQFKGKIVKIDPAIDPQSRTVTTEVIFENKQNSLTSGMYGLFKIKLSEKTNTIVIPDNALLTRTEVKIDPKTGKTVAQKQKYVFIVVDDRAQKIAVDTGLTSGDRVEITKGLRRGDLVVIVGQNTVKDGQKVRVIEEY